MDTKLLQLYRGLLDIPPELLPRFLKLRMQQCGMDIHDRFNGIAVMETMESVGGNETVCCLPDGNSAFSTQISAAILICMEEQSGIQSAGSIGVQIDGAAPYPNALRFKLTEQLPLGAFTLLISETADSGLVRDVLQAAESVGRVSVLPVQGNGIEVQFGVMDEKEQRSLPLIAMEHCADLIRNLIRLRHSA